MEYNNPNFQAHTQTPIQQNVIVYAKRKSVGVAFVLSFFFGPLGLLYASVTGGIIMFVLGVLLAIFTFGIGYIFVHIGCIIWAVIAANKANELNAGKIQNSYNPNINQPPTPLQTFTTSQPPPAVNASIPPASFISNQPASTEKADTPQTDPIPDDQINELSILTDNEQILNYTGDKMNPPSDLHLDSWFDRNKKSVFIGLAGVVVIMIGIVAFKFVLSLDFKKENIAANIDDTNLISPPENSVSPNQENNQPSSPVSEERQKLSPPFYMVSIAAFNNENEAIDKANSLRREGYNAGHLWIPDYASLSGTKMYAAFIGPFYSQYDCEVATENYRKINPKVYGVLVSNDPERVQINGIGKVVSNNKPHSTGGSNKIESCRTNSTSQSLIVNGDNVRVRSQTNVSDNNNILFKLGKGDTPAMIDQTRLANGELWYKICYSNFQGWISGQYANVAQGGIASPANATRLMTMKFMEYSEGDYPHLIFKELSTGEEFDFRHLSYNNYDGINLLVDDADASFGSRANQKYIGKTFLISARNKTVKDYDLDGKTFNTQALCITGIRPISE